MSVVNRMLLDIDRRHATTDIQDKGPYPDVRSVAAPPAAPGRRGFAVAALAALGLMGLAAVVIERGGHPDSPPAAASTIPPSALAKAPAPVAVTAPPAASAAVPAAVTVAPVETLPHAADAAPRKAPRAREGRPDFSSFKLSRELSAVEEKPASRPPAALPSLRLSMTEPAVATKPAAPLRQVAADETVAAARALWNDGARSGALATLRDALAVAEAARNAAAVAPIARELARLEVAENRPQPALDLLRRLEAPLAGDAEAWALRGNAEQRLALHADSARSYLAALRMRPTEGRWMLGAAISLAADGKVGEAQAWAERARDQGVASPAIEGFLRELGVTLRR